MARVITDFIRTAADSGMSREELAAYTTSRMTTKLQDEVGNTPFSTDLDYRFRRVLTVDASDTLALVAVTTTGDTLPIYGPVDIEMTFFMHRGGEHGWRIADMRRFRHIEGRSDEIRGIAESSDYPASLKPLIVRDYASVLLSNDRLRANFESNRARFAELASRFSGRDSLRILGRIDRNVGQLNRVAIEWGAAAQVIPKAIIDEYLASATPAQQTEMRASLKHVEGLRRAGRDSLTKIARRYRLSVPQLDRTVDLMYDLNVSFVNAELPWKKAVQMTVGGVVDDAIGYLYSPTGELPYISNDEYYYLEDLGGGWWIFRAG